MQLAPRPACHLGTPIRLPRLPPMPLVPLQRGHFPIPLSLRFAGISPFLLMANWPTFHFQDRQLTLRHPSACQPDQPGLESVLPGRPIRPGRDDPATSHLGSFIGGCVSVLAEAQGERGGQQIPAAIKPRTHSNGALSPSGSGLQGRTATTLATRVCITRGSVERH